MGQEDERRTVLVPQALGAEQFLRATWHAGRRVMVFSHWEGGRCVAATPVRIGDLAELASLTATALGDASLAPPWPPPLPVDRHDLVELERRSA